MPLAGQLIDLRAHLEAVGMVVVEEPDHLNVRLPFFCSVRVYSDGGQLRFDSRFGVVTRVKSTTMKVGGMTAIAIGAAHYGIAYAGAAALLAVMSGIYDSIRWQLTEHAITRIATIATFAAVAGPATRSLAGYGTGQILGAGQAGIATTDERVAVRERRAD